jgi:hypothetical protein
VLLDAPVPAEAVGEAGPAARDPGEEERANPDLDADRLHQEERSPGGERS